MARHGPRRFGVVLMSALMLGTSFSHVTAPPARAGIFSLLAANSAEDPADEIAANDALFAIGTVDLGGGKVCVVALEATPDTASCEHPAWGTPNEVVGVGTFIIPLEAAENLHVGTYRLYGQGDCLEFEPHVCATAAASALSQPFTITACNGVCDTHISDAILQGWKDSAQGGAADFTRSMCYLMTVANIFDPQTGAKVYHKSRRAGDWVEGKIEKRTGDLVGDVAEEGIGLIGFGLFEYGTVELNINLSYNDAMMSMTQDMLCNMRAMWNDIANDPPDQDFTTVAPPQFVEYPTVGSAGGDALVQSGEKARAYGTAQRIAVERYKAAVAAGDNKSAALQAQAIADFGLAFIDGLEGERNGLEHYAFVLQNTLGGDVPVLTADDRASVVALYQRIRTDGFFPSEIASLQSLGLTPAMIADVKSSYDLPIEDVPIGTTVADQAKALANAIDLALPDLDRLGANASVAAAELSKTFPNHAPVASFTALPSTGTSPLDVTFTDTSTDADNDPLTVAWDFGDGGTATGSPVSHHYLAGAFTATETVSDGSLSDTVNTLITAIPPAVNHDPTLVDDGATTPVNTPVTVPVLNNDYDVDGNSLTVSGSTTPAHGTATCSVSDCLYSPDPNYTGPDSFDYTVSDGQGGSATATVSITVSPGVEGNGPPVAVDDSLTLVVNKTNSVFVTANDSDPDNDSLSVTLKTQAAHGVATCYAFGLCNYVPAANYVGADSFDYTVSDGRGGIDIGTVNVTVEPNHDPQPQDDVLTTRENALLTRTVYVFGNDIDPDGDPISITSSTDAAHGTSSCQAGGYCYYTPDVDYVGPDTFTYTVSDGAGGSGTATIFVTVTPNHAPVAYPDTAMTVEGQPVAIFPASNDQDQDADALTITHATNPAHGSADCSSTLSCMYTPDPGFVGDDAFDYTISDGTDTDVGHVAVTVTPPCFPARCIDNGTILLAVNPEGHLNSFDGIGSPAGSGSVGLDYLPTNNDSTAPGCLCEGWGAADADSGVSGSADVAVGGVRNLHVVSFTVTGSTAISVVTIGDTLRVTHNYHPSTKTPNLYEATVTIENISGHPLNDIRYRRVMDWDIEPTPFSEFVTIQGGNASALLFDSDNGFETADPLGPRTNLGSTGDFVDVGPADHGALFDFGFGPLGTDKSTTFNIFYGGAANEAEANAAINAVGAEVYSIGESSTPDGPTLGTPNTFIFAFGSVGGDAIFSPVAVDDTLTTPTGTAGSVDVLANDSDPNNDPLTVTTLTPTAAHGTVSCTAAGICTYTPAAGYSGPDSFDYNISDGNGGSDTGTVAVTVGAPSNTPPIAADDAADAAKDGPGVHIDVLANDTDADATDVLTVQSVDLTGTTGSVVNNGTDVTYTPAAGFTGTDTFTYTVSDGHGGTDTATVTVTVKGNGPPVATDDSANANEHGPAIHVDVRANDTDPDSDSLTVTSVDTTGTKGTATNNETDVTYDPNGAFDGLAGGQTDTDTFAYTISDGHGGTDTATVTVTIHGQNDAPTLASVSDQTIPEMVLFNTLALSGSDPDGDSLTYSVQSGPSGLTVNAASGVVSWTPTEAQGPGDYPVTVRVADASLHADRSFTIHVTEVNRPPSLAAIADQTVNPGDVVGLTAVGSDPDLPANTLTYSLVAGPAGATVNPTTGAFAWTASSTLGDYAVTIRVTDGVGGTADRSFTIHVVRDTTSLTLGGDTSGQYSDHATITATLKVGSAGVPGASVSISLGAASQTVTTNAAGVASATFTIPGPAGSLATAASFAGTTSKAPSSASGTFTVNREDSTIVYSGDPIGLAGATLHLSATFTDSAAAGFGGPNPETGAGATIGDITKARIAFAVYNAATCLSGSPITTLSAFVTDTVIAGDGVGTATVTWSSSSEGSFCIVPFLVGAAGTGSNGYYTAPPAEAAGLAVFIDTAGKVTGGGWVAIGDGRGNFGFNATSNGTKVKGNLVFIERTTYQGKKAMLIIKSNAIDSLRTSGSVFPITATLSGKASFKYISSIDGSTLYESGNATFTATVVDTDIKSPPTGDSFAIRALDKTGAVLVDLGSTPLGSGNIVAHLR